jgi:hypothetical protein
MKLVLLVSGLTALSLASPAHAQCKWSEEPTSIGQDSESGFGFAEYVPADAPITGRSAGRCGTGTRLINTYQSAHSVPLGGRTYVGYYLSDKTGSPKCNRIFVRSACIVDVSQESNGWKVVLSNGAGGQRGTVFIDWNGRPSAASSPSFALLPANRRYKREDASVAQHIAKNVSDYQKAGAACRNGMSGDCREQSDFLAQDVVLNMLRAYRFPALMRNQRMQDQADFDRHMLGLPRVQRAVNQMIVGNEVGKDYSPYELRDATAGSGLSFGARQLDIGVNQDARRIFREIVRETKLARNPNLPRRIRIALNCPRESADAGRCETLERRIREYRVNLLSDLYRSVPVMNSENYFRSDFGRAAYDDHHRTYLNRSAAHIANLQQSSNFFASSWFGSLYMIDVENQYSGARRQALETRAKWLERRGYTVQQIEDDLVAQLQKSGGATEDRIAVANRAKGAHRVAAEYFGGTPGWGPQPVTRLGMR